MNTRSFYRKCKKLQSKLANDRIMNEPEVAEFLGVSSQYASEVMNQLVKDSLGSRYGYGPISRVNATVVDLKFYNRKIRDMNNGLITRLIAIGSFILSIISILMQVL